MTAPLPLILVVDDDEGVRASIAEYLQLHGFDVRVASGGGEMRAALAHCSPDLITLDLNMPGEDGLQLAQWLRARGSTPILMLTALDDPIDRVLGLEMGADEYMGKPFHPRELVARIRTVLRRAQSAKAETKPEAREVRFGPCLFDRNSGRLLRPDGVVHHLTGMEFDLLKAFADHPNRILSRDQLLALAHRGDWDPVDRSIDVRISRLRRKIGIDGASPVIRAVRNMGYVFEPG